MPVTIQIPTALRAFTDKRSEVTAEGRTVGEALGNFAAACPDVKAHLYDELGEVRSFINVYLGDRNVRNINGWDTRLDDGDVLMIVPAIAGGSARP